LDGAPMPVKKQVPLTGSAASRAAPARPPADAAPAAPAGPTKVKLDISVATKINELNASGELGQDIRKPKVARLLSQIDPKQAVEVLEGVWSTEASIQDPNAFINNVCSIFIEAAAAEAAAAEEEAWDEGAEEEAWDEGAGEEYQEEGADAEVAAPAPKRQKVASAYEDKLSPAVAKEVARLSQVLAEPIELRHVGESLAKLSADDAISVLGKLEKNAAKVDNPTVWLIQHLATSAQASVKGKGKQALPGDWWCPSCGAHNFASRTACCKCHAAKPATAGKGKGKGKEGAVEETRRDRVQQLLAQRQNAKKGKGGRKGGGPGGDAAGGGQQLTSEELAVLQKITEVNRKCGWSIKYRRVKTFLSLLDHQAQLSTIHSLFKKHQQNPIAEPDRWLEVACATRASKRSGVQKGKGAQKGKPRATGPQLAEGSKVMKRLRFIEKNVELAVPLEIPAVSSKLALLEEEVAMELLKTLAQKAAQLRNANGWLLGAVKKELEARQAPGPAAAPGLAEEWVFEDEDLDEGEA